MRFCPKCGTIVSEGPAPAGICGTDFWEAQNQSIQDVVTEAQKEKMAAD